MTSTTALSHELKLSQARAWGLAALFTVGNILLPQLCHLMPRGGLIFLPIYMFTLIAALVYGWRVGMVVALASPAVNCLLFGMPPVAMLPVITAKGMLLASAVGVGRKMFHGVNIKTALFAIAAYQVAGCLVESLICGDIYAGFQDLRIGLPGVALQVVVSLIVVAALRRRHSR